MYVEKMDVRRENGCTSRKWMYVCQTKEMYMHTARLVFTLIMALLFMGCPPPAGHNSNDSTSGGNAPAAAAGSDPQPKAIPVVQVSVGTYHTMILKEDSSLWAVGTNTVGQLGNDSTDRRLTPVKIMTGVAQVSAGGSHTMIVKKNGELWAVGRNREGQLGNGTGNNNELTAVQVRTAPGGRPMTEVDQVSANNNHTIILKTNGELWAVGDNTHGQLGDNTTDNRANPVQVLTAPLPAGGPMTGVAQISSGSAHTVILKTTDTLWAVGANSSGQLGDGTADARKLTPSQVMIAAGTPMDNVKQISAGSQHTMILKNDNTLWAVGLNDNGQLGDGTNDNAPNLVQVMNDVDYVSAGDFHTMIIKKDGSLWGFGLNTHGQLGDGTKNNANDPVEVRTAPAPAGRPMTEVAQVSAGPQHTMILKTNGTLWAVGSNGSGQLGNGDSTTVDQLTPVEITVE